MRSVNENLDLIQCAHEVVSTRLAQLRRDGADLQRIERELWRKKLIEETLQAIQETAARN